jgi:hypothetical protein
MNLSKLLSHNMFYIFLPGMRLRYREVNDGKDVLAVNFCQYVSIQEANRGS